MQVVIQTGFVYDDAARTRGGQDASIAGARAAPATGANHRATGCYADFERERGLAGEIVQCLWSASSGGLCLPLVPLLRSSRPGRTSRNDESGRHRCMRAHAGDAGACTR